MAKQYWVGEFFVDLSRNQISQLGQSQTLPPKALLVLTQLAERRGEVVSYDQLLDSVWPNSVVTPNTLQRCIAQLRKALGENSKAQSIIKTHAKQGYSLECDVSWSDNAQAVVNSTTHQSLLEHAEQITSDAEINTESNETNRNEQPNIEPLIASYSGKKYYAIAALIVVLISLFFLPGYLKTTPERQFGNLLYLTATDDKEFGATYSSDGQYILFRRYLDKLCINNIWAKNAETFEEVRLTKEEGTYGGYSLSADGERLAFIKEEDCSEPVTQNTCYKLMSLNFNDALLEPQTPVELLHCQHSGIAKPIWVDDQHIVMMQKEDERQHLIFYSTETKSTSPLYETEGGSIISYAYSAEQQLFAVTAHKNDGQQYIEMLTRDGQLISSHPILLPSIAPRHLRVHPEFIPHTEKLIFGGGSRLYSLSYEGDVELEDFQLNQNVGGPHFHPDGKRVLLITGIYDSDVARMPIPAMVENSAEQSKNEVAMSVFERSINREDYAKFRPSGDAIAIASWRTGLEQIWLVNDNNTRVISRFPKGTFIDSLIWHADGGSLLVNANDELHHLLLDGSSTSINFRYPVTTLFHWDSDQQRVIANIRVNGITRFVIIDLKSLEYQVIGSKKVSWAVKSQDNTLIFMDHMDRLWQKQQGAVEDKLIESLEGQGSSKRFLVRDELMYGINKSNQLWSYNLQSDAFNILGDVTSDTTYLTDVNDSELLMTVVVAAKKEVVEFSFTEQKSP